VRWYFAQQSLIAGTGPGLGLGLRGG
jgi:hypothetical protein